MSITTKKRFVTKQLKMELVLPSQDEYVARVIGSRGSYLLEVEDEHGEIYLASMPMKFRNTVWIIRGQFVLLQPIAEGDKVRAEISHVLDNENVLYIRENKKWPKKFEAEAEAMTRHSKRGEKPGVDIDPDLLPSMDSSDDDDDDFTDEKNETSDSDANELINEETSENEDSCKVIA